MADLAREGQAAEEIAEVVGQGEELEPYFVVAELVAGKARPGQSDLSFFDPLLGGASLVVELDDSLGAPC